MKTVLKGTCAVLALAVIMTSNAFAATQSATVPVSASVSSALVLNTTLVSLVSGSTTETPATSMAFGVLAKNTFGGMDASKYFKMYISANSQGLPHIITQNGTAVSNGAQTLPNNACKVTPTYEAGNNGGAALVGTIGSAGTWVGNRTLYTSNGAGDQRTIAVYYGLVGSSPAGGPALPAGDFVPDTQAAGSYSGTVVFTVTA